jgi:hypothetical protein
VSVALQSVDGVTAVNVTPEGSRAKLALKPGNTVTLAELRRLIERNGFTSQSTTACCRQFLRWGGTHLTR